MRLVGAEIDGASSGVVYNVLLVSQHTSGWQNGAWSGAAQSSPEPESLEMCHLRVLVSREVFLTTGHGVGVRNTQTLYYQTLESLRQTQILGT